LPSACGVNSFRGGFAPHNTKGVWSPIHTICAAGLLTRRAKVPHDRSGRPRRVDALHSRGTRWPHGPETPPAFGAPAHPTRPSSAADAGAWTAARCGLTKSTRNVPAEGPAANDTLQPMVRCHIPSRRNTGTVPSFCISQYFGCLGISLRFSASTPKISFSTTAKS
jgi:hypothetical protein